MISKLVGIFFAFVGPALLLAAPAPMALKVPSAADAKLYSEASFLADLLKKGGAVYFRLPENALPSRDPKGQWRPEPLQAALRSQGPLALKGDIESASAGHSIGIEPVAGEDEGRWLIAAGMPSIVLVEDSSTVSPLSKGLNSWKWPYKLTGFSELEHNPREFLNSAKFDLVVFSSPGWWDDFANPPGGPSRLPKKVAEALRDFVRQGGTALFIDIAQWDLEKAWPKTLSLNPLGPYQVSKLNLEGSASGGVSLAPVGVATDRLRAAGAFGLLGHPAFGYSDGGTRELFAAYAMPDPGGGQGWIAGLALHVFEQDEGLAARLRRLFLNIMLLSGTRRLSTQGEPTAPTPGPATATITPRRSPSVSPTESMTLTVGPSFTSTITLVPTAPPTQIPTSAPTPVATLVPTRLPTLVPTRIATVVPTRLATPISKPQVEIMPTALATMTRVVLTTFPTRTVPTPRATATRWVLPSPVPTFVIPTLAPTKVVPTQQPTPAHHRKPKLKPSHRPKNILVPTLLPTPAPTINVPIAVDLGEGVKNALGCLDSAPEPFGDGGVYLQFCLKYPAKIQVNIYDSLGRPLWHSDTLAMGAGNQQVYYDGRANGHFIVPGRYLWEVRAQYESGSAETRQGALTRRREKHLR